MTAQAEETAVSHGWPDGFTPVSKTPVGNYEISTIVVNAEGMFCYGETIVFDTRTGDSVAEQRCDPDDLTLALQHQEWVSRMLSDRPVVDTDYERQGRDEIEWHCDSISSDVAGGVDLAGTIRYAYDDRA